MERTIKASEANQRFSEMLRQVQAGDSFVVLSRGRPVARVTPVDPKLQEQAERVRALSRKFKERPRLQAYGWKREDLYD